MAALSTDTAVADVGVDSSAAVDLSMFDTEETVLAVRVPGRGAYLLRELPAVRPFVYKFPKQQGKGKKRSVLMEGKSSTLLLTPRVTAAADLPEEALQTIADSNGEIVNYTVRSNYNHASYKELLTKLLPEDVPVPTGFETVGQIAHYNLREVHWPHRHVIGKICMLKNPGLRTVVAKIGEVVGEFRTFGMDVIAGCNDTSVRLVENGVKLEFDFRQVYWNSRLSEERVRLSREVLPGDVVFDMFAGIGALALMCAKKGCRVFANDLNPAACEFAKHNAALNRLELDVSCLDAREFLRRHITVNSNPSSANTAGCDGLDASSDNRPSAHLVMNLPELAPEFLDGLKLVATGDPSKIVAVGADRRINRLRVHCYCFAYSEDEVAPRILAAMGSIPQGMTVRPTRLVAPQKYMLCAEFDLHVGTPP